MRTDKERAELDNFEIAEEYDFSQGIRGRFYEPKKVSTTLRIDNDVLLYIKKRAREEHIGYQTLINQLLRQYAERVRTE